MNKISNGIKGAIIAGILGLFFATIGFWRTLLIAFMIVLGFLIGSYIETRRK